MDDGLACRRWRAAVVFRMFFRQWVSGTFVAMTYIISLERDNINDRAMLEFFNIKY